ncbi:MAG TPA: SpoIIE family protein phosphatase [Frankiaceae bacterium]|nr:SpoIIE family protein phosphatase [Frankiaceae bacterium]
MPSSRRPVESRDAVSDDARAAQLRLELAVDAAAIGGFEWDLVTNELIWDERMRMLLGVDADAQPSVEGFVRRILPADRAAVERANERAIALSGDLRVDYRIIDEAGATRWLTTRGRVLSDVDGQPARMVGAVFDSSGVHDDREQVARALDTMATAYAIVDSDWTVRYANQAARVLVARNREPVGTPIWDLVPGLTNPSVAGLLRGVMAGKDPARIELRAERLGGWLEVSVQPVANGIAVLVSDVTARREAQNEAERAVDRLALLAQAGTTLVQRRRVAETVDAGLALLVPKLATSAMIYLREGADAPLRLVGLLHDDPQTQDDLRQLFQALPLGDDPKTAAGRAVATQQTQLIGDLDAATINRATDDPRLRGRLLAMGATGVVAVPLVAHGESLGFIGLVGLQGQAPSGPDLVLIEDITSRIAAAIDSAQILDQVDQARQTAEQATARLAFLASVADALGSTLDPEQASTRLARMLVPALADWVMVTLLDDDGRVGDIASFHRDTASQELLDRYTRARHGSLLSDPALLNEVVTIGQPLFQLDRDTFGRRLGSDPSAQMLQELDPGVVTALPILARDRTLGVISFYNSPSRGYPSEEEMDAAREVTRRAGLVLDNARMYSRSKSMAETLQRSLLDAEVMQPPGLDISPHYETALEGAQVGGDWYDAFQTPDGTTTLVIGDVMGHDTEAAALMGQLRTLVRAIAVDRGEAPGAVLTRVDHAAEALGVNTTATAVVAQVFDGMVGGARRLRWSNAGHPPPVLIEPDGTVRLLETPADLLLGLGTHTPRADHEIDLAPGSTVLLFTDGLVEGRLQPLETGLAKLTEVAQRLSGLPLPQLCEQLLRILRPLGGAEDDVALVAVRVLADTDTPPIR